MYKTKLTKENVKEFSAVVKTAFKNVVADAKSKELGKAFLELYLEFIEMCQLISGLISRCVRRLWTLSWQGAIIAIALMLFKEHCPIEYASFMNSVAEAISTGKEAWTVFINNLHIL